MDDTNSVRDLLRQAVTKRISELEKIIEHYKNIDFNDKNVVNFYCSVFVCCKEQTSTFEEAFICQNNGEIDYSKLLGSVHHTQRYMDIHRNSYIYPWTKNSEKIQVFDDIEERFLISPQELIKTPIPYDFKNIDPQDFAPHQQIYFFKKTKNSMFQNVSNITFLNQNVDEKKKIVSVTHIETIGKDAEKNIENLKSLTIGKKQIGHRINFDSNQKSVSKKSKKNTKTKVAKKGTDVRDETSEKIDKLLEMFDSNMDAFNFNPVDDDKENLNVKENPDLSTKEVKGKLIEKGSPFPVLKDKENSVSTIKEHLEKEETVKSDVPVLLYNVVVKKFQKLRLFPVENNETTEERAIELEKKFDFYCKNRTENYPKTDVLNIAIKELQRKVDFTNYFFDFFSLAAQKSKDLKQSQWEQDVLWELVFLQNDSENKKLFSKCGETLEQLAKHNQEFVGTKLEKEKIAKNYGESRKKEEQLKASEVYLIFCYVVTLLYLPKEAFKLAEKFLNHFPIPTTPEQREEEAAIINEYIAFFELPEDTV